MMILTYIARSPLLNVINIFRNNVHNNHKRSELLFPFYSYKNGDSKRSSKLPKDMKLVNS